MKNNKGFTLIELMIVIAIIAIIAAIAIPNLMQSRIRANEATAVTVIKAYTTAQVTWQIGRQGSVTGNSSAGPMGYASNYRNLHYGLARSDAASAAAGTGTRLQLISQAHADAATDAADNDGTTGTVGTPGLVGAYQGYYFTSPTGMTEDDEASWFESDFAQLAIPANSTSTGTNAYFVGQQGAVWMLGLAVDQTVDDTETAIIDATKNPVTAGVANWVTL